MFIFVPSALPIIGHWFKWAGSVTRRATLNAMLWIRSLDSGVRSPESAVWAQIIVIFHVFRLIFHFHFDLTRCVKKLLK